MKKLLQYSKPYYIHIILASFSSIGISVCNVWIIDILKNIIDAEISHNFSTIAHQLSIGTIAVILGMISNYLTIYMTGHYSAAILRDLRKKAIEKLSQTSPDYMEKNNFGDIIAILSDDITNVCAYLETYFKDCMYVPVMIVVFSAYLISLNPLLAVLSISPLAILVPLSVKFMKPVKISQMEYVKLLGDTNNNIQSIYDGAEIVKAYNLQGIMNEKYFLKLEQTLKISQKNDIRQYHIEPISNMIYDLPVIITLCLGGFLVFNQKLTIGILIAFLSITKRLIEPLGRAYQLVVRTQMALINLNRIFYIIDTPPGENTDLPLIKDKNCENVFELKNVFFSYEAAENDKPALSSINLSIKKGQKVAFVGASGSGKSSLAKLLYKHYSVTEGNIFYYGNDYKTINPVLLRNDISLISQDNIIFPMTIEENIRIGNPAASCEEILEAAKAANCMEFIDKLPKGIHSFAGEKGSSLSGGQKQRISIARAILKNSEVLILDEPTSALDKNSENLINKTISKISENKTVICVAHRLDTIKNYDKIFVINSGSIAEEGTHEELMKKNGLYCQMYTNYTNSGGDSN